MGYGDLGDKKCAVVERTDNSQIYEEARRGKKLSRKREVNNDIGVRNITITEKGWRVAER